MLCVLVISVRLQFHREQFQILILEILGTVPAYKPKYIDQKCRLGYKKELMDYYVEQTVKKDTLI